jgi:hypothetical protein
VNNLFPPVVARLRGTSASVLADACWGWGGGGGGGRGARGGGGGRAPRGEDVAGRDSYLHAVAVAFVHLDECLLHSVEDIWFTILLFSVWSELWILPAESTHREQTLHMQL